MFPVIGGTKGKLDLARAAALAAALLVFSPVVAEPGHPASAAEAEPAAADEAPVQVDAGDLTRLVAPVALYPDPLLALVLQASVQPLQLVQAERFLAKRADDPALAPDPDWDPSILGLLNYPALIGSMSEYLDWTETVGDAVVDRLPEVQDAVQQIRWSAYQAGLLGTTEHQQVMIEGDVVRIMPVDADTISVPKYDPEALLVAIAAPPEAEATPPGETVAAAPGDAGQGQTAPAAEPSATAVQPLAEAGIPPPEPAAEAPAQVEEPPPAPAPPSAEPAPAYTEPAPVTSYATPAPAPAYVAPAPAYAGPPVVSYAEPQSTFWSSAATFTGGAVVGGLLGYAIGDDWFDGDEDIDWDEIDIDEGDLDELRGRRGGVNIEDNTIVAGGDRVDRNQVQAELRGRREGARVAARPSTRVQAQATGVSRATARPKGVAPVRSAKVAPVRATKQVAVPNSRRAARATTARPTAGTRAATPARATATQARTAARPATGRAPAASGRQAAGLAADVGQGHAARKEAQRGAASRARAQPRTSTSPRAATAPRPAQPRAVAVPARAAPRAAAPTRQASRPATPARQSAGGLSAGFAGGDKVRLQANRGHASRGGGRRG